MKAIVMKSPGGPDTLTLDQRDQPVATDGHVVVRVTAAGVNFIDTYQRSGLYPVATPYVPGFEGAGDVVEVGPGVTDVAVGDRVAWTGTPGSYAEYVAVPRTDVYAIPDGLDTTTAAALMLQGLTAHYLCTSVYPLGPGDVALVHAGAGGVGLLLTQLATARGARVIATTSSADKAALARGAGASDVLRYDTFEHMSTDLPAAVRDLTDGEGVHVVYDGVGAATFDGSLASLRTRGTMALFGGASGPVPPFDLQRLNKSGSLFITRPSMGHFLRTDDERAWRSGELFDAVLAGELNVRIGHTFGLHDAAQAHAALEGRQTTGKVLLQP
ncbi:MAG: quinone oxidoreductase [Demequina sp.]